MPNSFPDNDNELSSLSRNNKNDTIIQEKYIASGDGNDKNHHNNRFDNDFYKRVFQFNILFIFDFKKY